MHWVTAQGCATDRPLFRGGLTSLGPVKAVRRETPEIGKFAGAGLWLGGLLYGGIGADAALNHSVSFRGKILAFSPAGRLKYAACFFESALREVPGDPRS